METKVNKFHDQNPIPAGIIDGMEAFWNEKTKTKWLAVDGTIMPFDRWPVEIQNNIVGLFRKDTYSRAYLNKKGITSFSEAFDRWWRCVIGGLDGTPDFVGKRVIPDAFINTCSCTDCPDRGKLCGRASMLKSFEVETILTLAHGYSIRQSANILFVSVAAIKKRIETINNKLGTRNMASMIATSSGLGII